MMLNSDSSAKPMDVIKLRMFRSLQTPRVGMLRAASETGGICGRNGNRQVRSIRCQCQAIFSAEISANTPRFFDFSTWSRKSMFVVTRNSFAVSSLARMDAREQNAQNLHHASLSHRRADAKMAGTSVDKVILKGIKFEAVVGLDAWHRPGKTQPVELELHLGPQGGLDAAAREDSVNYTIDYGKLYKSLKAVVFDQKFESVAKLYQAIRASLPEVSSWFISVVLPKAILAANNGIQFSWTGEPEDNSLMSVLQHMKIRDLECRCVIGVNSHERLQKQKLQVTITVWGMENHLSPSLLAGVDMEPSPGLAYQDMVKEVVEVSASPIYTF